MEAFAAYEPVRVKIVSDRGIAFIEVPARRAYAMVRDTDGSKLMGRLLSVSVARPRDNDPTVRQDDSRPFPRREDQGFQPPRDDQRDQRPYNRDRDDRPFNRDRGPQRPFDGNRGPNRPYGGDQGAQQPDDRGPQRPYDRERGPQRPYDRDRGPQRPDDRPYNGPRRFDGNRPPQNDQDMRRPYNGPRRFDGDSRPPAGGQGPRREWTPRPPNSGGPRPWQKRDDSRPSRPYQDRTSSENSPSKPPSDGTPPKRDFTPRQFKGKPGGSKGGPKPGFRGNRKSRP